MSASLFFRKGKRKKGLTTHYAKHRREPAFHLLESFLGAGRCLLHQAEVSIFIVVETALDPLVEAGICWTRSPPPSNESLSSAREVIMNLGVAHGLQDEVHLRQAPVPRAHRIKSAF